MENNSKTGQDLIRHHIQTAKNESRYTSEDLVGIFTPILAQLERIHANGLVGLTRGLESFSISENGRLQIDESLIREHKINLEPIAAILPDDHSSFDIVAEQKLTTNIETSLLEIKDNTVSEDIPEHILAPIFVPAYKSYESILDHHDALTDIHTLGLVMASLAFSLDLENKVDVKSLNQIVKNPAYISNTVHPNILRLILDMVQLDRRKRIRDAYSSRIRLENYLEYSYTSQEDLDDVLEQYSPKEGDRNKWILSKLRNRLFDLSKRNRLIYFKKSSRYVNLTLSSVPYVLDYKNIRAEKLFIWNDEISGHLKKGSNIRLNKYLQIKENPQIATSLKKVYYEGNRDKAEFGFNQLKLAFCFLNWYNYKENKNEKIQSPLLLIPVSVKKKKGINDDFTLELLETEAQVNPVLAYYLKELFDIRLPKTYDLSQMPIEEIYESVKKSILSKSNEVQIDMVIKPRLRLIHSLAKRSFEAYQKKIRQAVSRSIWGGDGNYSYDSSDYRPLGLKLYKEKVKSNSSVLEFLIDPSIKSTHNAVEVSATKELYQIESDGNIDPYKWEFDLCNFTLGNFNYKRMTLVNDYDSMMDQNIHNEVFETLFSKDPKVDFEAEGKQNQLSDNYCVIPADPTQLISIQKAKEGRSYIIQGPPGTGKSQTIANLLASKVAAGKTILFISEKRAALDVVYARMSQIGLKDICTLIHDSQTDKKAFIFDLKDTYEKYSKEENRLGQLTIDRERIIGELDRLTKVLSRFHSYQSKGSEGVKVREIIDILMSKGFRKEALDSGVYAHAPSYSSWNDQKVVLTNLEAAIKNSTKYKSLANCPFLSMDIKVAKVDSTEFVTQSCDTIEREMTWVRKKLLESVTDDIQSISQMDRLVSAIGSVSQLYQVDLLEILDVESQTTKDYRAEIEGLAESKVAYANAGEKTKHWRRKPTRDEVRRLYAQYQESTAGFFNKLLGKKGQFIDKLAEFYDFDAHMVPPEPEEIFRDIQSELDAKARLDQMIAQSPISRKLGNISLSKARESLGVLVQESGNNDLLRDTSFRQLIENSEEFIGKYNQLKTCKDRLVHSLDDINQIYDALDDIRISAPALFSLAPRLQEWYALPAELRKFVTDTKLSIDQIEYAAAYKFLLQSQQEEGAELTGAEMSRVVDKIAELYPQLLTLNSDYVSQTVQKNFQDALDLNYIPSYELTEAQAAKKKSYHEGRATLENEFNKKIRYKSIRELADGDTGVVIKDLKPIWMMSPLSVSDTLPIESMFDIVIFDEASQITVEEGIPPLYRASQAIIVGDEMQMPPSDFFSTKVDDSDEEAEYLSMDAESLLNQGVRKLPQVTLGWHYRSRQEALINFSNFAFYQGSLMTIPDAIHPRSEGEPIEVFERSDAIENVPKLLKKSITYHYLPNGVYHNRQNDEEAIYIAHMVRELLLGASERSVGIVAFSMQQQGNIERALSDLAEQDRKFAIALDEAYSGSDDEEFTGLFVKNLENVQGDERDVMILSICYGYSPKGRMLMNFGPINRRGGEKRLNVIFSRAKHNMAVVASIKHSDITNESNEGANYLKKYLQYAELISTGEEEAAMSILNNLNRKAQKVDLENQSNILTSLLCQALESKGYHISTNLGQSRLKIDIGIKKSVDQEDYNLGIIVDSMQSYESENVLNEYYNKSNILEAFGWKIYKVYANDWFKNKDVVLRAIIDEIEAKTTPKAEVSISQPEESKKKEVVRSLINETRGKFWTITRSETKVTIKMGDIGDEGILNTQHFDREAEAIEYFDNQVENRKGRGYV